MFRLKTLPACDPDDPDTVGKTAGFSLHAGVAAKGRERDQLERLCRYITRPAVSGKRLSLTAHGKVRYERHRPERTLLYSSESTSWGMYPAADRY